jgi:hypothetical protein
MERKNTENIRVLDQVDVSSYTTFGRLAACFGEGIEALCQTLVWIQGSQMEIKLTGGEGLIDVTDMRESDATLRFQIKKRKTKQPQNGHAPSYKPPRKKSSIS